VTLPVAARVLSLLGQRQQTLATAESLTGGLIGELLTDVAGASAVYQGGVISYATSLKTTLAGVDEQILSAHGPVAALTAEQMAAGAATRCGADWGLSATGVAGPDSQDGHPVGQVFVAVAQPAVGYARVHELSLSGSRREIRRQAAHEALALLEDALGMRSRGSGVESSR
jgi:nicotinamide-nucleotide amidase